MSGSARLLQFICQNSLEQALGVPTLTVPSVDFDALVSLDTTPWGRQRRDWSFQGIFHFYTEDYRWSAVVNRPWYVPERCRAAVELNFSTADDMPFPVFLFDLYRKRFVSRLWQAGGLPVFVDLSVTYRWRDLALAGVPVDYPLYAVRGSTVMAVQRAVDQADLNCPSGRFRLLVVGGDDVLRAFCLYHENRDNIWWRRARARSRG